MCAFNYCCTVLLLVLSLPCCVKHSDSNGALRKPKALKTYDASWYKYHVGRLKRLSYRQAISRRIRGRVVVVVVMLICE